MVSKSLSSASGAAKVFQARVSTLMEQLAGSAKCTTRFEKEFSRELDAYFEARLVELGIRKVKMALVAVGGYGREELGVSSPIHVLIVCRRKIIPQAIDIAQPLFLPLWDAGYALKHSFKNISECTREAGKDFRALAALLDARLIVGDAGILEEMRLRLQEKVLQKKEQMFVAWLAEERTRRQQEQADISSQVEPDLKEGVGGLRDYHRLLWLIRLKGGSGDVGKALRLSGFSDSDRKTLLHNVAFLHEVRNRLHALSGTSRNVFELKFQKEIALAMGFSGNDSVLPVEEFLGKLHRSMDEVSALTEAFSLEFGREREHVSDTFIEVDGVSFVEGFVSITPLEALKETPSLILDAYSHAACVGKGVSLGWKTRQAVTDFVARSPERFPQISNIGESLVAIFRSGNAFGILEQMVDSGVLSAILPAFEYSRDIVRFDGQQTYSIGRHTLFAIRALEQLRESHEPHLSKMWRELPDCLPVFFAALFFELTNGEETAEREKQSAYIAHSQLEAWGLAELAPIVASLVESQMLLSRLAHQLDIADIGLVAREATQITDSMQLDMLYLLAYAERKASGGSAWSAWAASRFATTHERLGPLLCTGSSVPDAATEKQTVLHRLYDLAAAHRVLAHSDWKTICDALPDRYLRITPSENSIRHMCLAVQLQKKLSQHREALGANVSNELAGRGILVLDAHPHMQDSPVWEVAVVANNQHGFFTTVCGVLPLHNCNVLSADAFVWDNGMVVDTFLVEVPAIDIFKTGGAGQDFWQAIEADIHKALTGRLALEHRVSGIRPPVLGSQYLHVNLDNSLSDSHTVIDIAVSDRPALLYDIARTLQAMQLEVLYAKIITHGDDTSDSFSVCDAFGKKLVEEEQMVEVRNALLHALGGSPC